MNFKFVSGDYIRKYCPELRHFPNHLIHEPWKSHPAELTQFKCEIGKDYPHRIVIHDMEANMNKGRMKRRVKRDAEFTDVIRLTEITEKLRMLKLKEDPMSENYSLVIPESQQVRCLYQ